MLIDFSSFHFGGAAFFEEAFALVWALDDFKRAALRDVELHFASLNALAAVVGARDLEVGAAVSDVIVHAVERKHLSAFEEASNNPEMAIVHLVSVQILPEYFPAPFTIWTCHWRIITDTKMLINISNLGYSCTLNIWAID